MKKEKMKTYDVIILGTGPAGLSAAIYASRYNLKTLVLGNVFESLINEAHLVENYPGFESISGAELLKKIKKHAEKSGAEISEKLVNKIVKVKDGFEVYIENQKLKAKSIILALGTKKRKLDVKGEKEFLGKGVSYCYVCDANFFVDKNVAVIGGSNSAALAGLLLSEKCKKVYIIYRKTKMRCEPVFLDRLNKKKNVEIIYSVLPKEIRGRNKVEKVILDNNKELKVDGIFVEIGEVPSSVLLKDLKIKTDKNGYVIVDEYKATNVKGVFAAGDITKNVLKQVITASADGVIAATSAYKYVKELGEKEEIV